MQMFAQRIENGYAAVKIELADLAVHREGNGDKSGRRCSGLGRPRRQRLRCDRHEGRAACNHFSPGDVRHACLEPWVQPSSADPPTLGISHYRRRRSDCAYGRAVHLGWWRASIQDHNARSQ